MSVGELQIKADTTQAITATQALDAQFQKTAGHMQAGMQKAGAAAKSTGLEWTELSSKIGLLGGAANAIGGIFSKFSAIARERGVLFSQFGNEAELSGLKLMQYSTAVDHMINANALMRSSNALVNGDLAITEDQFESVTKAAVQFARASGENVNDVLKRITDTISSGSTRGLKQFGVVVDDTGTKAEKTARMVEELDKRFRDVKISAGDAAEDLDKYNNEMKQLVLLGGDKTEDLTRKWYGLKDSITQGFAAWIDLDRETVRKTQINKVVDRINQDIEKSQTLLVDMARGVADMGEKWTAAADESGRTLIQFERLDEDRKKSANDGYEASKKQIVVLGSAIARQKALNDIAEKTGDAHGYDLVKLVRMEQALKQAVILQERLAKGADRYGEFLFGDRAKMTAAAGASGWAAIAEMTVEAEKASKKLTADEIFQLKVRQREVGNYVQFVESEMQKLADWETKRYKDLDSVRKSLRDEDIKEQQRWAEKYKIAWEHAGDGALRTLEIAREIEKLAKKDDIASRMQRDTLKAEYEQVTANERWKASYKEKIDNQQKAFGVYRELLNEEAQNEYARVETQRKIALYKNDEIGAQRALNALKALDQSAKNKYVGGLEEKQINADLQAKTYLYGQFADSQKISIELTRLEISLKEQSKNGDIEGMRVTAERITQLKEQQDGLGKFNLKMKEWETSSYGAMGALSNVWRASADAFLMTDAQLRKAGKTRTQVIKEALQAQILALGKQNLFEGGTSLAKGFAALAMGSPAAAGFFKASAVHFSVALAAGVGNSLFGGGSAKNDSTDKKTAPTTSVKTSETQQKNYTIIIPGGVVVNRDDMARNVQAAIGDARGRGWVA
jgi:hypothetical protein